jgi:hypothetical protein
MAERIRKLPNEPITIYSAPPNGGIDTLVEDSEVVRTLWNQQSEPIYHVVDFSSVGALDLDAIAKIAASAGLGEEALFHDPMLKEVLFVSQNSAFNYAAQGLASAIYGNIPIYVFDTVEAALTYARAQVQRAG